MKEFAGLLCGPSFCHVGKYALGIGPKVVMVRFLLLPDERRARSDAVSPR